MDSADNNTQCTCELCQPNWYLGKEGEFHAAEPVVLAAKVVSKQPTDEAMFSRYFEAMSTGLHAH